MLTKYPGSETMDISMKILRKHQYWEKLDAHDENFDWLYKKKISEKKNAAKKRNIKNIINIQHYRPMFAEKLKQEGYKTDVK